MHLPRFALPRRRLACLALSTAAMAQAQTAVPLCLTDFPPYVSAELPDARMQLGFFVRTDRKAPLRC